MKKNALFSLLALLFLWLVWVIAYYAVKNAFLFPSVGDTFSALFKLLGEGEFWRAFGGTLLRTLLAFLISLVLGTALASLACVVHWVRAFLAPVISVLRSVPTMALVLFLLLWTSPAVAPVIVALLVLMPTAYAGALASLDSARAEYGELCSAFRVKRSRRVFRMYLPLVAPAMLTEGGSIFSTGLKIVVSGEVLAATYHSVGCMMQEAQIYLITPRLFALTLVTVLLGFLLEGVCYFFGKLLGRWRA